MIDNPWIAFTVLAALMQAVRTAGQKQLANNVTAMSSTLIRYVFGLPFTVLYLFTVCQLQTGTLFYNALTEVRFVLFASAAGVAQIVATFLLIKAFSYRNFTVGTSFAKTEAVQTAVLGTLVFGSSLSATGWLAVAIGFLGVFVISAPSANQRWEPAAVLFGTLSGTAFSVTSLCLREASLSLQLPVLQSAAITLVFMVSLQSCLCLAYTLMREPGQFTAIRRRWRLSYFVGLTSAAGSVGWFTAMTYQNPALVKSLGQIEILFTLCLTTLFFKEKVTLRELLGVSAIIGSVVLIVWHH
ncbi:MAG: DMT family transporter [Granulosicoccus sp.]